MPLFPVLFSRYRFFPVLIVLVLIVLVLIFPILIFLVLIFPVLIAGQEIYL